MACLLNLSLCSFKCLCRSVLWVIEFDLLVCQASGQMYGKTIIVVDMYVCMCQFVRLGKIYFVDLLSLLCKFMSLPAAVDSFSLLSSYPVSSSHTLEL